MKIIKRKGVKTCSLHKFPRLAKEKIFKYSEYVGWIERPATYKRVLERQDSECVGWIKRPMTCKKNFQTKAMRSKKRPMA